MSANVKGILSTLRARLQSTGYTLVQGRMVDPASDTIPAVSMAFHPDKGIEQDESGQPVMTQSMEALYLVVTAVAEITDITQSLEALEDLHTAIHAAVFDAADRRLGGYARDDMRLMHRQSFVPDEYDSVGMIQLTLKIPYLEKY